ncbi:hypothetical protein [Polyangium aurulentum]|uniref:hypothetical protein n=1 Tax=Polyangium aurulentum TaxID=2567896 RepID=UPI001137B5AE|nr:hypothetical protein [Polyangium aurulentum]UQA59438.1 hypothetical protein E8A73_002715 [Polyangium aurulentum]
MTSAARSSLLSAAMQIDRSRFLLLTATMAGGACGPATPAPAAGGPVVAAPVVALPAQPEDASGGRAGASPPARAGLASGEDEAGEDPEEVGDPLDENPDDLGALACDDAGVRPLSCAPLRAPGPQCESFADTKDMCNKLSHGLRPRVAEAAVDCILAKSGKQAICSFEVANQCATAAARKACIEPKTQAACAPLVRACNGQLAMKDCQSMLSAVTEKNRRRMLTCMTEGCSADYCMYEVE